MKEEKVWTTAEISQRLHVSRQAVSRWIRTGKLPAIVITVGARPIYRVRDRDYRAFVSRYVRGEDDW
jgi:excisionase family DNA binding protein